MAVRHRDSLNLSAIERAGAVALKLAVAFVLLESVFDDANGDVSLVGNVGALAIGFGLSAVLITAIWASRRTR